MSDNNTTYVPVGNRPTRFENLWPGSYFRIVAEPSRRIRESKDERIYLKDRNGFFSIHPGTGLGVVLMPQDIVQPMRRVRSQQKENK